MIKQKQENIMFMIGQVWNPYIIIPRLFCTDIKSIKYIPKYLTND